VTALNQRLVDADGNDPVRGDTLAVVRTVTSVPSGDSLASAKLTIKAKDTDTTNILQKSITTVGTADGQITDTGAGDQTGALRINVLSTDYGSIVAHKTYAYDIQVTTANGTVDTIEKGKVKFIQDVTA
jgi:hypothetical protein